MKVIAIIPARYSSTRFPGKPLADIFGKPMIYWVYNQAKKVNSLQDVYVATDDEKIEAVCKTYNMNVIMTSVNHATGTDRICEVAEKIPADLYINIQGDEPLIEPEVIEEAIKPFFSDEHLQVSNLMCKIKDPIEFVNFTVPKVLTNNLNQAVYLTRSPAPYPKGEIEYPVYKQVCVYGFKLAALRFFETSERGKLEKIEDIEILRFIESGIRVQYVEVESNTIAVDTKNDLEKLRKYIINHNIEME